MKKKYVLILLGCLSLSLLCGCEKEKTKEATRKLQLKAESYVEQEAIWNKGNQEKNPKFTDENIRQLILTHDGKTMFQLAYCPKSGRRSFLSWRLLQPYYDTATVDTEKMHDLYKKIVDLKLSKTGSEKNSGIDCPRAVISVAYCKDKKSTEATNTIELLVGKEKNDKSYYCAYKGRESELFIVDKKQVDEILKQKSEDLILQLPYLVDVKNISKVIVDCQGKQTVMKCSDGHFYFKGKEISEKDYHNKFAKLMMLTIDGDNCETNTKIDFTVLHIQFFGVKPEDDRDVKIMKDSRNRKYIKVNDKATFYLKNEEVTQLTNFFLS